jgi:hypothetical protein
MHFRHVEKKMSNKHSKHVAVNEAMRQRGFESRQKLMLALY